MESKMEFGERPRPAESGETKEGERAASVFLNRFKEGDLRHLEIKDLDLLRSLEIQKTADQELSIKIANDLTNELLSQLNLPIFDVPLNNIYFFDSRSVDSKGHAALQKIFNSTSGEGISAFDSSAITDVDAQIICVDLASIENPIGLASTLIHEIVHLKAFSSVRFSNRRLDVNSGVIRIERRNKKRMQVGVGLDEAITTEIERRLLHFLLERHPGLSADADKIFDSKLALETRGLTNIVESPLLQNEIMTVDESGVSIPFAYFEERQVLYYLVETIAKDRRESPEDVMPLFMSAEFTGDVSNILKAIEESFGKGAYRLVNTIEEKRSAIRALKLLKDRRKDSERGPVISSKK
jgi:hypothetical protein